MIVATQMEKYSSFKQQVAFATLNPNSIAIIASILGWNCILGFTENKKICLINWWFIINISSFKGN